MGEFDPPVEDCRIQLQRILKSSDFDATARERRFLGYVVEETLSGRAGRIKAYSIAVEVFGRDASFDPQTDPIVRIEAGHLRRSLERYYLTAGQADPILITIPKGAYVPTFSSRPRPAAVETASPPAPETVESPEPARWRKPSWLTVALAALVAALAVLALELVPINLRATAPEIPQLLVEPFEDLSGTETSAAVTRGLTQEVIGHLAKFKDIVVIESARPDEAAKTPRFVLAGSVSLSADAFRLRVRFINRSSGSVLWANSYDGDMDVAKLLEAQADIARNVATTLAQTYGVIFQADAAIRMDNPPDDWAAYSCTLSFYAYWIVLDPKTRSSVRDCLERVVDRFPNYATAWGLLSLVYIDDYRFQFPDDPASSQAALERALAAARRAVDLDPRNIRGLHAQMLALYFNKEIDAALAVGKQAFAINPNDTELIGEYGSRLAVAGHWQEGCALSAEARQRKPGASSSYDVDLALCTYFTGDYPQAAMWIKKTTFPNNPIYHIIAAAIFGEGGYEIEADRERSWLEQNAPMLVKNIRQEASMRLARSQDVDFFLGSLRKAGLSITD